MDLEAERRQDLEAQYQLMLRSTAIALAGGLALAYALAAVLSSGTATVMSAANPKLVLYPVFAMFLLVTIVLTRMGLLRVTAVRRGRVAMNFYRTYDEGAEPGPMRLVTRQFINLFEMPVLFYVVVIFAHMTGNVTYWIVGLAWAYAALRYLHCAIHLTTNHVPLRLSVYVSSGIVLLVTWVTLLVQLLRSP